MAELVGNLLVAQSGGPTAVINASVAGVIQEAGRYPDQIQEIYGGLSGILGILNEDLIDLQEEKRQAIEGLKHTPAAALGTSRYKIDFKKKPEHAARDMDRLFQVFQAHNVRYFFYAGGNDSQDTAHKIHEQAIKLGFEMRVIGVPKTIDNDLPHTDHCPGYGSVVKYNATTVMEIAADVGSMATDGGSCCIIEVMGRAAGWIAAGTVLAKRRPAEAPHIILIPEVPFEQEKFLARVREIVAALKCCIVVVGEGLKNAAGEEIAADKTKLDAFGHPVLSGAAERLADIVEENLRLKTRTVKLGYAPRGSRSRDQVRVARARARRQFLFQANLFQHDEFRQPARYRQAQLPFNQRMRVFDEFFVRQKSVVADPVARDQVLDVRDVAQRL